MTVSTAGRALEKTVVITGGTGGLGTALVRRLIFEDYRLVVTYLHAR